jgi:hypothetical protein
MPELAHLYNPPPTMTIFDPEPGELLALPAVDDRAGTYPLAEYRIDQHPIQPNFAYATEGAKAIIYRLLRVSDGTRWALKVWKDEFRAVSAAAARESASRLDSLLATPGFPELDAAIRTTLDQRTDLVRKFPALDEAVLMKWAGGQTCFDLFQSLPKGQSPEPREILRMAREFIDVMVKLEKLQVTHTDISSGNVSIEVEAAPAGPIGSKRTPSNVKVQLIDLEDFWRKGIQVKTNYTPGYGHPRFSDGASSATPWGDRYATTILLVELLLMHDRALGRMYAGDGLFRGNRESQEVEPRYEAAIEKLNTLSPSLASVFEETWTSSDVEQCKSASHLRGILFDDGIADRMVQPTVYQGLKDKLENFDLRLRLPKLGIGAKAAAAREMVAYRCPRCKSSTAEKDKFCSNCGSAL